MKAKENSENGFFLHWMLSWQNRLQYIQRYTRSINQHNHQRNLLKALLDSAIRLRDVTTTTNKRRTKEFENNSDNESTNEGPLNDTATVSKTELSELQILLKISKQCEEMKTEFKKYRDSTKTVISELEAKIDTLC